MSEDRDRARDEDVSDQGFEGPSSLRETLDAFFAAGWPTEGVPLFLAGGYVTKERQMSLAYVVADYIDQATNHPRARPLEAFPPAPERASA